MNCFNGEQYLQEAIDSIYSQTYSNWEIIFWDNASNDKSAKIANSYDKKLLYFRNEVNIPLGAARNKALLKCKGNYISFLDVDDICLPEKLEIQIELIRKNPDSILFYSDGFNLFNEKKSTKRFSSHLNTKFYEGDIFKHLIMSNFINWQTVLINKVLAGSDLYFNEKLSFSEDYEILLRLSLRGKITFSKKALIYYRIHDNNISLDHELVLRESEEIFYLFKDNIKKSNINMNIVRSRLYGSVILKLIKRRSNYELYTKYLLKYYNIQNIIVYILIKLNLVKYFFK